MRKKGARFKKSFHSSKPLIWFHSSSGEFEYAKPLIKALKEKYSNYNVLATYFSPSYEKVVQNFKWVDVSQALPMDFPSTMLSFIKKFKPKALFIAKTDLWPEMLYQCKRQNVFTALFSVTSFPSSQSKTPSHFFSFIFSQLKKLSPHFLFSKIYHSWVHSFLNQVFCVTQEDKNLFCKKTISLNEENVIPVGDTRYDQVFEKLKTMNSKKAQLLNQLQKFKIPLFIAGSTWPEDERVLIKALQKFLKTKALKLILVPHEPHAKALQSLNQLFNQYSLKMLLYSSFKKETLWKENEILVIDQVGLLAHLYSIGSLAFVGGSFKGSVHSVMESLSAGLFTFVGPFYKKNREALEFKSFCLNKIKKPDFFPPSWANTPFVLPIKNAEELHWSVENHLKEFSFENLSFQKKMISERLKKKRGASLRLLSHVEKKLKLRSEKN